MSLIWTLIDVFLFIELVIVLLLTLPIASATTWNRFFKSQFLAMLAKQAHLYFSMIIGLLVLSLIEALREMRKYSFEGGQEEEQHLDVEMQQHMRLFRAQRNFYISGFAIFLVMVIKRLINLISHQAFLLAESEASMKQAESATRRARALLDVRPIRKVTGEEVTEITKLKDRIHELTSELNREKKDKEALKSQAESLNKEYDRLTEEYSKLQKKITISGDGGKGGAKDD
ncbi:B-cell receptor-associated protein 31 isoform X2 [Stomoxys calcitrans]|uniref:Endoplasmic reticulum transmembrane protein n=1 Tax=Stomoxys calcitrans TaxID=35570 RepID=A0A1I8Q9X0_STOCA|nr:B-cell receptor-associated protein 31 isoform X2 [Stomoxys calcitrans]